MKRIRKTLNDMKFMVVTALAGTFLGMVWAGEFLNIIFLILPIGFLLIVFTTFIIRDLIADKF